MARQSRSAHSLADHESLIQNCNRKAPGALASTPNLALLTLGALGGQCVWSTEMAFASPYLLHLGMSKSGMAIVFVAGPLSGLIVQPCIGLISDQSTHHWGRRRPLLVLACFITTLALLLLGFARALAGLFIQDADTRNRVTIVLVIASIFAIDFSVNAVNALNRALLLDLVPMHRQSMAYAWAARLAGIGSILGFAIGQTDLTLLFPFSHLSWVQADRESGIDSTEAQIRCVSLLVSFLLVVTQFVTILVAKETPLRKAEISNVEGRERAQKHRGFFALVSYPVSLAKELTAAAYELPRPILEIFRVHFFLSFSAYPLLFYSTTWVSQIIMRTTSLDESTAVRLGSLAMLYHASVVLICVLVLPSAVSLYKRMVLRRQSDSLTLLWAISSFCMAFGLLSTIFADHMVLATIIVALTGFPMACSAWAPFALIGILVRKQSEGVDAESFALSSHYERSPIDQNGPDAIPLMQRDSLEDERGIHQDGHPTPRRTQETDVGGNARNHAQQLPDNIHVEAPSQVQGEGGGTIIGLHNISIVAAHFLMTAYSTIVFAILEPGAIPIHGAAPSATSTTATPVKHESDAIGFVLRTGGAASVIAGYYALRLARQYSHLLEG